MTTPTATESAKTTAKQPDAAQIAVAKFGSISVAAFKREATTKAGDAFTAFDFNIRKSFRKADGSWDHASVSIGRKDVLNAVLALQQCYIDSYQPDSDSDEDADE
jgi:hypothetical protein